MFESDSGDFQCLIEAKGGEMRRAGVSHPSDTVIRKALSKEELLRHCRRRTRGVDETTAALEALLLSLSSATDTLGVPLLKDEMQMIWEEQKHHIPCLQDPPNVELYTLVTRIEKGGNSSSTFSVCKGFHIA